MSNQHLLSYLFMILIVRLTHGIPPPEGHAGVHDHHENGDTISITPEDEEKLQNFQLRFAEVRNKICDADTLSEDKLNAIHACHNKGPVAADSPQIMACEKQVFGEKTLDQKRKDMCNASHAERREKGHAVSNAFIGLQNLLWFSQIYAA